MVLKYKWRKSFVIIIKIGNLEANLTFIFLSKKEPVFELMVKIMSSVLEVTKSETQIEITCDIKLVGWFDPTLLKKKKLYALILFSFFGWIGGKSGFIFYFFIYINCG